MARLTEYTDDQVAHSLAVLESTGGNAKKTAKMLGIPLTTLRGWAGKTGSAKARPKQAVPELVADSRKKLLANWERVAVEATGLIPEKLDKASAKDLAVVSGIATEKIELLSGRATTRSESLRIELVAGGSLKELAERTMSVQVALPSRTGIARSTIDVAQDVADRDKAEKL